MAAKMIWTFDSLGWGKKFKNLSCSESNTLFSADNAIGILTPLRDDIHGTG